MTMSKPDKITIVIITFRNDFQLLVNLLQSIYKHWKSHQIDSIKIVLNDIPKYKTFFQKLIQDNTNKDFKINEYYLSDIIPEIEHFDWHSQQLAKCVISKEVTTEWYLIHDCKDTYIEQVSIDDCFTPEGKCIMHIDHTRYNGYIDSPNPTSHWGFGPFSLAYQSSCKIWNLDHREHKKKHLPFLTPFFIKTKMMSDMVEELESMFKTLFPFMFSLHLDGQLFVTEFLLYNAYCTSKNNLQDYEDWSFNNRKFFSCVRQSLQGRNSNGSRIMSF